MKTSANAVIRRIGAVAVAGLLFVGLAASVAAHETREVEGEFEFVVGFMNEPAYLNEMNGLDLRISYADDGSEVEFAEETLNATIEHGGETQELDIRALWGQPGAYTADVIPTSTGTYTFHITGDIEGVSVNESFQGGPETFSEVEDTAALEFPGDGSGSSDSDSDQVAAIAIAGVVAGVLGMVAGGAAFYKAGNSGGRQPNPAQQRREQRQSAQSEQSDE